MIVFSDIALRRGAKLLFSDASFSIPAAQKVGLAGSNGCGKSSLFALIMGELSADEGQLSLPPGWVIAHVAQQTPSTNASALDYVLQGDVEYIELHSRLKEAEGVHLAELHSHLEQIDGYTAPSRAATLLHGLGFSQAQTAQPVNQFSGGWRMRLNLAQALMCRSDLLLLDEPTNHLDLDAVIWLQSWLNRYPGTLLLISHDREFLDAVIEQVLHVENAHLTLYPGNYSAFERIRAERLAQQQSAFQKQQREISHMQAYVDRFRAKATKAKQAQSRLKALQRMEQIAPAHIDSPFHFVFPRPAKLPERLLHIDSVTVGYGESAILNGITLQLMPGQRIGLLGPNGAGKSTLVKLLAGELTPLAGNLWQAQHLKTGYFAQHQLEQLDPSRSALAHLRELDTVAREQELRDFLGGFGFQGSRVDEPVAPFSGGEKSRLVLALLVYQGPNLLLLDEPTNHLDIEMRLALSIALQEFEGAVVVVSHDRYLLKTVADEFLFVHDGRVEAYDGDLDEYARLIQSLGKEKNTSDGGGREAERELVDQPVSPAKSQSVSHRSGKPTDGQFSGDFEPPPASRKEQRQQAAELRRLLQPLKNKLTKTEQQVESLSIKKEALEKALADPDIYLEQNRERLKQSLLEQSELVKQLEDAEARWMELLEQYEVAQR